MCGIGPDRQSEGESIHPNAMVDSYTLQGLAGVEKPRLQLADLVTACALSVGKPVDPAHDEDEIIFLIASMIQSVGRQPSSG